MNKCTVLFLLTFLACFLVAKEPSYPTQLPQSDSLKFRRYTLETVRVIGEIPAETIGSITVKPLDTALQPAPVNIKESLQNVSGVSVTVGTKDESNLRIRGFRKNEVKILIDGRPLNAGYFGSVDLQNLPLSDIKTIYILKGPVSSMYGNNTMGGVVNLITNAPSSKKWAHLGMQFKRNNTNHIELSTSHSFSNWNYWLYGARDNTDGFVLSGDFKPTAAENGDIRNNLQKTQYNLQAKANLNLSELHTLGITAGFTTIERKKIPQSIYGIGEEYRLFKDWQRYQSTLMDDYIISENQNIKTMLWLDGGQDTYQTFSDAEYHNQNINSTLKYRTLGFNPRWEWQMHEKAKLNTGYRGEIVFSNRKDNGSYLDWTQHYIQIHNLFTQMEYQINERLSLTGGAGLAMSKNDKRNNLSAFLEPTLGAYYEFTDGTTASVAAGLNSAYPTMQQLFSSDKGNPDLRPQTSAKYEISLQKPVSLNFIKGSVQTDFYYNAVKNLIDEINGKYRNVDKVTTYGAEASILFQPLKNWEVNCSYALLETAGDTHYKLTESPLNSAEFSTVYYFPSEISLAITSSYKDYRLSQDAGFDYRILSSYWTHGLVIKKSWQDIRLSLGLENITDTYYEEEYGYPAAGRNFSLQLEADI
jgi:outer membrane cobalamin receptor